MIEPLIDGAIKRRKVVLGVTLAACLFGLFAYFSMPRESFPDIDFPYITVVVPFPGVSPEDSERLLVKPLEVELQTIQGLKHMNAVARQGAAILSLEFQPDAPRQRVLDDIRAKVDLARGRFPPDAEPPIIQEQGFADRPVIEVVLHGAAPERELARISKDLKERLEATPLVQEAFESGAREEVLEVDIDPLRMESYNVTATDLGGVIARNNQLVPAGNLRSGAAMFAVKVPGVVRSPADILALPIKKAGDRLVTIGDIGSVRRTFKDPAFITRFNGESAVALDVTKRHGANILDTVKTIRGVVAEASKTWPSTVKVDFTADNS